MIVGGFLTSEAWLEQSISQKKKQPQGLFYPGLIKKSLQVHICSSVESEMGMLCDLLKALGDEGAVALLSLPQLRKAWAEYLGSHGLRSQPWKNGIHLFGCR